MAEYKAITFADPSEGEEHDYVDILFRKNPEDVPFSPSFVETENSAGMSIGLGEWVQDPVVDEFIRLRIWVRPLAP